MDEGATLGVSLRSTSGPTVGSGSALRVSEWVVVLVLGETLVGPLLVGLEGLSLEGLHGGMLELSVTELEAVEGGKFTTMRGVSTAAGLFGRK